MRAKGQHHQSFTATLWAKWLARLNEAPDMKLRAGIQEFRALLARRELRRRAR